MLEKGERGGRGNDKKRHRGEKEMRKKGERRWM